MVFIQTSDFSGFSSDGKFGRLPRMTQILESCFYPMIIHKMSVLFSDSTILKSNQPEIKRMKIDKDGDNRKGNSSKLINSF